MAQQWWKATFGRAKMCDFAVITQSFCRYCAVIVLSLRRKGKKKAVNWQKKNLPLLPSF